MKAILTRLSAESKQTLGRLELFDGTRKVFECKTLELPWLDNQKQKSCIPTGTYTITARSSAKYGLHFLVNNVPNRDAILIHYGNYYTDILGCILVGATFTDLNGDGFRDVTSSRDTLKKLLQIAPQGFTLIIHDFKK